MDDISNLITKAQSWAPARMAIATVVQTWGSAPRPRGSHMLVNEDGRFEGSVSGGCVENAILASAESVIASGESVLHRFGVSDGDAWEAGLPCGGEIAVLVQPVTDAGFAPALLDQVREARARGETLAVSTDVESGLSVAGERPGQFVNRYRPPRRLIITGAVQIAQGLAGLARELGIATTIVDPRGRFLTRERFPDAMLDDRWPDEAVVALRPNLATAVVTLSHDPKIDDPALIEALRAPTGYVAALGSRKSHAARRERLAAAGISPADLDRIDGPAGIDIGALGPGEIALSIAAGMIQAFNRVDARMTEAA
ncbi:MAG: XdhC family protein [Sphingobium sp.]|uniref:XdhC family protein n=1 Tax=Sphingobium sp. TaxID=1912891 RepID=UPI0029A3098B|nr:XdhC family protein [Sphingobium sp.]MDX3909380.1 XdhC family protein [Sphingobium sp.]